MKIVKIGGKKRSKNDKMVVKIVRRGFKIVYEKILKWLNAHPRFLHRCIINCREIQLSFFFLKYIFQEYTN